MFVVTYDCEYIASLTGKSLMTTVRSERTNSCSEDGEKEVKNRVAGAGL
jgi:hypothetical protein